MDDQGVRGGLEDKQTFVVMGDLNTDSIDGNSRHEAILRLLDHPRVQDSLPKSQGSTQRMRTPSNTRADPANATAMFQFGNLRVDYVLPSAGLSIVDSGVYWPNATSPGADWLAATDHRLVWVTVQWPPVRPSLRRLRP